MNIDVQMIFIWTHTQTHKQTNTNTQTPLISRVIMFGGDDVSLVAQAAAMEAGTEPTPAASAHWPPQ